MYPPSDGRLLYAHVSLSLSLSFPLRAVLKAPRPRLEIIGKRLGPFIEGKKREEKRERKRKGSRGKREEAEQSYPVQNCFASLIISFPRFPFLYTARRTVFIANCGGAWLKKTSEFVYKGKKEKKRERKRKGARGPHLSSQLAVSPSSPPLPPPPRARGQILWQNLYGAAISISDPFYTHRRHVTSISPSRKTARRGGGFSRALPESISRGRFGENRRRLIMYSRGNVIRDRLPAIRSTKKRECKKMPQAFPVSIPPSFPPKRRVIAPADRSPARTPDAPRGLLDSPIFEKRKEKSGGRQIRHKGSRCAVRFKSSASVAPPPSLPLSLSLSCVRRINDFRNLGTAEYRERAASTDDAAEACRSFPMRDVPF